MSDPFGPFGDVARSLARPILVNALLAIAFGALCGFALGLLVLSASPFGVVVTTGLVALTFMFVGTLTTTTVFYRRMV